jgi:drug/metabolite transporter (DMT)-like permease
VIALTMSALVGFAANSLLTRSALADARIDAASFTAIRLVSGAVVLALLTRARHASRASLHTQTTLTQATGSWPSALALAGYAVAFTLAYRRIGAGIGALTLFGAVQATMIGRGLLQGERPSFRDGVGCVLALIGLASLTLPGAAAPDLPGLALMAIAGACWGLYSLRGRTSRDPLADTAGNFARAALPGLAFVLLSLKSAFITPGGVWLAVASGAIASGVGYSLWYAALPALSAWRAAVVQLSVPVLTAAAATVILREMPTMRLVEAAALIFSGVLLSVWPVGRRVTRAILIALALVGATASMARAQNSWGLAVAPTGEIYFCDGARDRVWMFGHDGTLIPVLNDTHCHTLVSAPDGLIYGEAVASDLVLNSNLGLWRMAGRTSQWVMVPTRAPDPSVWLVMDRAGRQYAWAGADVDTAVSVITRRDPEGVVGVLAGHAWGGRDGTGDQAELGAIAGMAIAPDGTLIVADSGNVRRIDESGVVKTEAVGVLTGTTGGLPQRIGLWNHSMGVAADVDGSAVVVDYAARRIIRVSRGGQTSVLWQSGGWANALTRHGWGWRPTGVAMMGRTFYVMEDWPLPGLLADLIGSPRVLQVNRDGSYTRVTSAWSLLARVSATLLLVMTFSWVTTRRASTRRAS